MQEKTRLRSKESNTALWGRFVLLCALYYWCPIFSSIWLRRPFLSWQGSYSFLFSFSKTSEWNIGGVCYKTVIIHKKEKQIIECENVANASVRIIFCIAYHSWELAFLRRCNRIRSRLECTILVSKISYQWYEFGG